MLKNLFFKVSQESKIDIWLKECARKIPLGSFSLSKKQALYEMLVVYDRSHKEPVMSDHTVLLRDAGPAKIDVTVAKLRGLVIENTQNWGVQKLNPLMAHGVCEGVREMLENGSNDISYKIMVNSVICQLWSIMNVTL